MHSAALCFTCTQDHAHVNNFVEACHALAVFEDLEEESALAFYMTCLIQGDLGAASRDDVIYLYIYLGKAIVTSIVLGKSLIVKSLAV